VPNRPALRLVRLVEEDQEDQEDAEGGHEDALVAVERTLSAILRPPAGNADWYSVSCASLRATASDVSAGLEALANALRDAPGRSSPAHAPVRQLADEFTRWNRLVTREYGYRCVPIPRRDAIVVDAWCDLRTAALQVLLRVLAWLDPELDTATMLRAELEQDEATRRVALAHVRTSHLHATEGARVVDGVTSVLFVTALVSQLQSNPLVAYLRSANRGLIDRAAADARAERRAVLERGSADAFEVFLLRWRVCATLELVIEDEARVRRSMLSLVAG
jgi:hypothetical protein